MFSSYPVSAEADLIPEVVTKCLTTEGHQGDSFQVKKNLKTEKQNKVKKTQTVSGLHEHVDESRSL